MNKLGIILDNGCCKPLKDYRIFDYYEAVNSGRFILLSSQGYRTKADALQDARTMGIKIRRKFEL